MALVRTQPLPAGRYWIDVRGEQLDAWMAWIKANPGTVTVEHAEPVEVTPFIGPAVGITFFIFSTARPLQFDQRLFGFPSSAPADIKSANDTAQRPPTPSIKSEFIDPLLEQVQAAAGSNLGRALLIGVLLYAFTKAGGSK